MAEGILDVDDIKGAMVSLTVSDQAYSSQVSPTGRHHNVANIELDKVLYLPCFDVNLNRIVDTDLRVRIANGSAIMCDTVWDALLTKRYSLDFTQLVLWYECV